MPAFSTDDILGNRLDFEIARDGFVSRLGDGAVLRDAETWLLREGCRVIVLDAGAWSDDKQMHIAFATALQFPSHREEPGCAQRLPVRRRRGGVRMGRDRDRPRPDPLRLR